MDGVLIDSEEFICQAAIEMFGEMGYTVHPHDFLPFVGAGEDRYIGGVADQYGIALNLEESKVRTYHIYDRLIEGKLGPLPGAGGFVQKVRNKGLKTAVASSADRMKVDINLREIGFSESLFDAIVSGLDVMHKKPDPEIFLTAAKLVGVEPQDCLVIEDAVNGVKAAKAAGCRCLAITSSFSKAELQGADWFAKNLIEAPDECLVW